MSLLLRLSYKRTLRATALALASAAVCGTAFAALPEFTFNPLAGGITGAPPSTIKADNILISNFSTVMVDAAGNFTDTGFLAVSSFQLGGSTFTPPGFNSTYGLYFAFTATGTQSVANPAVTPTFGTFSSLTYTLFGYNGTGTFGFSGNTPTVTTSGAQTTLASGTLISGSVSSIPTGDGSTFTPSAGARVTWTVLDNPFFVSPIPFFTRAETAFTNTSTQVEPFAGGFRIRQGGGTVNFISAIPEPSTYGLLLAGLAAVGFIARRRRG